MGRPLRVVFFGTPPFAARVLEYLLDHGIEIVAVVTRSDKPQGRSGRPQPSAVKEVVLQRLGSLPFLQPDKISADEWKETLKQWNADLFVVVAYGEILKQHILAMPALACINLHASLLPKLRGAAPIQRAIMSGESVTGVSIMHMVKKMDAGDIIRTAEVPVEEGMTYGQLEQALCTVGAPLLLQVIQEFETSAPAHVPQDESLVTFASKIELEECQIDWNQSAQLIQRLIHGVNPEPGAWCWILLNGQRKRLKIWRTHLNTAIQGEPGTLSTSPKSLFVATGEGGLEIVQLQLEGKKVMAAMDWVRGVGVHNIKLLGLE